MFHFSKLPSELKRSVLQSDLWAETRELSRANRDLYSHVILQSATLPKRIKEICFCAHTPASFTIYVPYKYLTNPCANADRVPRFEMPSKIGPAHTDYVTALMRMIRICQRIYIRLDSDETAADPGFLKNLSHFFADLGLLSNLRCCQRLECYAHPNVATIILAHLDSLRCVDLCGVIFSGELDTVARVVYSQFLHQAAVQKSSTLFTNQLCRRSLELPVGNWVHFANRWLDFQVGLRSFLNGHFPRRSPDQTAVLRGVFDRDDAGLPVGIFGEITADSYLKDIVRIVGECSTVDRRSPMIALNEADREIIATVCQLSSQENSGANWWSLDLLDREQRRKWLEYTHSAHALKRVFSQKCKSHNGKGEEEYLIFLSVNGQSDRAQFYTNIFMIWMKRGERKADL